MWLHRHRTLVTAGLVFAVTFMLVFVAIIPIYQNTNTLLLKITAKTTEKNELVNKVSVLSKLDPPTVAARVAVLNAALPPKKDVLLYLSAVDGLSRELGLTFGGLSLSPGELNASGSAKKTVTTSGLQTLETDIKIQGGKENIYTFLRTIEQVLPLMQVKDIKVTVLADQQYILSVTLGMLWADPQTTAVKGVITLFGGEEEKYFTELSQYRKFIGVLPATQDTGSAKNSDLFTPFTLESSPANNATESAIPQP